MRAGGFYETAVADDAYANIDFPGGADVRRQPGDLADVRPLGARGRLSASLSWRTSPSRRPTGASTSRCPTAACQPPYTDPELCNAHYLGQPSPTVNAGRYAAVSHYLSLAVLYRYGRIHARRKRCRIAPDGRTSRDALDGRARSRSRPSAALAAGAALSRDGWPGGRAGARPSMPPIWRRGPTRRCTCCCRRRCSTSTSPTSTSGVDKATQAKLDEIAGGKPYSTGLDYQLAQAVMDAQRAVVQMQFVRDIPFNRWVDVVKENLEQAREAGLISKEVEQRVGSNLPLLVRRHQGSRLREGRPPDLRHQPATACARSSSPPTARCCIDRFDAGAEPGARRAGQLLRPEERLPRAADPLAVREPLTAAPVRHRRRRPPEAGHRAGRAVTLVLGFFITRLQVLLDVDQQIPPGHPLVIVGQADREAVRRQVHDGDRLLSGVRHHLHAGHPGQGQARDRGAGEDPGRQAGQRAVADVAAGEGRPQLGRRARDHAARRQGAARPTPRSPPSARG